MFDYKGGVDRCKGLSEHFLQELRIIILIYNYQTKNIVYPTTMSEEIDVLIKRNGSYNRNINST
jgi:hypothetical protein